MSFKTKMADSLAIALALPRKNYGSYSKHTKYQPFEANDALEQKPWNGKNHSDLVESLPR